MYFCIHVQESLCVTIVKITPHTLHTQNYMHTHITRVYVQMHVCVCVKKGEHVCGTCMLVCVAASR